MKRTKITELRKLELIEAVISAIHQYGFANLTVTQIADQAETSTGSIHYYYGGKEALLEATMRHLLNILKLATVRLLDGKIVPKERLMAIVRGNFDESLYVTQNCSVWTQFWAHAPYSIGLSRLQNLNKRRVKSNLQRELHHMVLPENVEVVRTAIQRYMDGVWLNAAQSRDVLEPSLAQSNACAFVDLLIKEANTSTNISL